MKRLTLFTFVLSACLALILPGAALAKEDKEPLKIYDLMACNVYVDFDQSFVPTKIKKEQHKFLLSFAPYEKGVFVPDMIESITAYGPDGYTVDFKVNQKYDSINKNGYIYDESYGTYWYMVNLDTGFMKEGKYTIKAKLKNGKELEISRVQKNAPSDAMVATYKKNKQKIFDSYAPSMKKPLPADTPLDCIEVTNTSLKDLAGLDAYYIFRLCQGDKSSDFNTQKLIWWDNIFAQKFYGNGAAGLNRDKVLITKKLKPKTGYVYFTEITDSNDMGNTNICIFQPHQVFKTP